LFYEEVNYAASRAFQRLTGDGHAFWAALESRGSREVYAVTGDEFDFDDHQEMRRRLPGCLRAAWAAGLGTAGERSYSARACLMSRPGMRLPIATLHGRG
jgi:hypothetical protein